MLSQRNILEQITTIAVVLIMVAGTAWLLIDLAQTPGAPSWSRQIQPASPAWSERDVPQPLRDIQTDVARCGEIGPKAG